MTNAQQMFTLTLMIIGLNAVSGFQTLPHRFAVPHRPTLSKASLKSTIDDYAVFAMAEECIDDGECSIEQAENLMNDVLSIQANCVASIDEISPICNEALLTSELIVGLRAKIKSEVEVNTFLGKAAADFEELATFTFNEETGAFDPMAAMVAPMRIEYIGSLVFLALLVHEQVANPNLEPFTAVEWEMSLRDGYFIDMLTHHMGLGF
ncbi:hypothetical protein TrVE_jg5272 [Triparma verrucosa]|uniref:Uncharacterized protein n=1 Tax=Triparma verrucosa TaxID=1606542 RepID=A0A9W7B609_9STRA|nr:hypothetical protein TrVE_jg5272 [Triparma verrucosa]